MKQKLTCQLSVSYAPMRAFDEARWWYGMRMLMGIAAAGTALSGVFPAAAMPSESYLRTCGPKDALTSKGNEMEADDYATLCAAVFQ